MKNCSKCKTVKHDSEFTTGQRYCKPCARSAAREWAKNNKERNAASKKLWIRENKDKHLAADSDWRSRNRDAVKRYNGRVVGGLEDSYVAHLIGLDVSSASPEIIAAKREHVLHTRSLRELKKTINEKLKGTNES